VIVPHTLSLCPFHETLPVLLALCRTGTLCCGESRLVPFLLTPSKNSPNRNNYLVITKSDSEMALGSLLRVSKGSSLNMEIEAPVIRPTIAKASVTEPSVSEPGPVIEAFLPLN
jgi:hypothetical protein